MSTYTLYVMSNSPYSDKIRMYLRLKRLPFVEVRENMRNRESVLRARTGKTMVPVVITPEDGAMNDSTLITRALEKRHAKPGLRPTEPGRRGLDALLEEYADEWVVRAMLASRWYHEADAEQNRILIAADMTCGAPEVDLGAAKTMLPQGIVSTLPPMGATPDSLSYLMDELRGLCRDLDAIFARHRFLGGAEPSVADLAFYGQLNQVRRDPTGGRIVGDPELPNLARWFGDVEKRADDQPATLAADAPPDADALAPLVRRIASTYLRFAVANARAVEEAPKGSLEVALEGGVAFRAARAGYNRKCLQALLGELEAAFAAGGRLAGAATDGPILAELAALGPLLEPFPAVAKAASEAPR
jgi:glutathione S-transferase